MKQGILYNGIITCIIMLPLYSYAADANDIKKLMELQASTQHVHLDLSSADLRKYPFIPGKINLEQANLSHSNLSGVDLSKMNLAGADLSYADLSNAILNQVNLANANLDHTNLSGAQITHSDLSNANLTCTNLNSANLSNSIFNNTVISGATFINTNTADVIGYHSVIDSNTNCS